jgi:hypothetical protein
MFQTYKLQAFGRVDGSQQFILMSQTEPIVSLSNVVMTLGSSGHMLGFNEYVHCFI